MTVRRCPMLWWQVYQQNNLELQKRRVPDKDTEESHKPCTLQNAPQQHWLGAKLAGPTVLHKVNSYCILQTRFIIVIVTVVVIPIIIHPHHRHSIFEDGKDGKVGTAINLCYLHNTKTIMSLLSAACQFRCHFSGLIANLTRATPKGNRMDPLTAQNTLHRWFCLTLWISETICFTL